MYDINVMPINTLNARNLINFADTRFVLFPNLTIEVMACFVYNESYMSKTHIAKLHTMHSIYVLFSSVVEHNELDGRLILFTYCIVCMLP